MTAVLQNARQCVFSPCRHYRYTLWREWDDEGPLFTPNSIVRAFQYLMVIGLNPSTADETKDDPTIRRCVDFAKRWGFTALCMTNLFAWRDTKPERMMKAENPIGEDNQHHLLSCASNAGMVLAAWGKRGSFHNQDLTVTEWLRSINVPLYCLRKNDDGSPEHPLYVPKTTLPIILSDVVGNSHAAGASSPIPPPSPSPVSVVTKKDFVGRA